MTACLLIVLIVVVANLPYLLRIFNPNPVNQVSGLGITSSKGVLPGLDSIDPNNGLNAQGQGHRAALDLWHGVVPWWNHFVGVGAPLAGDMQSAAFLPLTLLLGFSTGQLFFHIGLELVAGVATYFLLRRLAIHRWAAFAGGAAFCLNGTFAWFGHAAVNPVAFLPVLVLGIENARSAAAQARRWGWALMACGLALSIYAGFPETAYIDGALAGLWVLIRTIKLGRVATMRFMGKVAAGFVAGLLLAAPILVAFANYLADGYTGAHNGSIGHRFLVSGALPMTTLPYIYGPIFGFTPYSRVGTLNAAWGNVGGYITTALLLLAAFGLVGRRHRALRLVLGAWAALAVAKSFGVPLAMTAVNALPQMVNTAFYRYSPVSWEFAVIVLAALGLDDLVAGEVPLIRIVGGTVLALLAIVLLARASLPLIHQLVGAPHHRVWAVGSVFWAGGIVVALAAVALVVRGPARTALLTALVVIDVLVMFMIPELSAPRHASVDLAPVAFLRAHLGSARFYTLGPIAPNYGSYFGLASAAETDVPVPKRWADYLTKNLDTNTDPINFTGANQVDLAGPSPPAEFVRHLANWEEVGVKYVVLPPDMVLPTAPGGPQLPRVFADQRAQILEVPDPKPYADDQSGRCQVTVVSAQTMRATCPGPSTMVRRELYMPGWHAWINGRPVPVTVQNALFQSIALPAGDSTVNFGFEPPGMAPALLALVLGLLALASPIFMDRLLALGDRRKSAPGPRAATRPAGP